MPSKKAYLNSLVEKLIKKQGSFISYRSLTSRQHNYIDKKGTFKQAPRIFFTFAVSQRITLETKIQKEIRVSLCYSML